MANRSSTQVRRTKTYLVNPRRAADDPVSSLEICEDREERWFDACDEQSSALRLSARQRRSSALWRDWIGRTMIHPSQISSRVQSESSQPNRSCYELQRFSSFCCSSLRNERLCKTIWNRCGNNWEASRIRSLGGGAATTVTGMFHRVMGAGGRRPGQALQTSDVAWPMAACQRDNSEGQNSEKPNRPAQLSQVLNLLVGFCRHGPHFPNRQRTGLAQLPVRRGACLSGRCLRAG
jgi:hypothetical protein